MNTNYIVRNVKETKGVINKGSELIGRGARRTVARNMAITEQKLANHSKTKLGKQLHETRSSNANFQAKYIDKKIKQAKNSPLAAYIYELVPWMDVDMITRPYARLSGRTTTVGNEALDLVFTSGTVGLVKDLKYIKEQKHKS